MDDIGKINLDFIENVLPHLFLKRELPKVYNYSGGQGPGTFSFKLDIESLLECAPEYKPMTASFVHFTSLSALNSIFSEQCIRLYNLLNVNDPKEFKLFTSKFGFSDYQIEIFKSRIHVCSFCDSAVLQSEEILTYWRTYGLDGFGCVIEFEVQDPTQRMSHIKLANIQYTNPDFTDFFAANAEFEKRHNIKTELGELVYLQACLHKDPIYKPEREVRLLYEDGFAESHRVCEDGYTFGFDINKKGRIVSYNKVRLYDNRPGYPKIGLKRIQFGYNIAPKDAKEYEDHLTMLLISFASNAGIYFELPVFEVSPLYEKFH